MMTISNGLTILRAPLAFLLLYENPILRISAIFLAMLSDSIDGYLARKSRSTSKLGAVLDPVMDKFFVYFALFVFFSDNQIKSWQIFTFVSRDSALFRFGSYLIACRKWQKAKLRPIRWGKVATALQFIVLMSLSLSIKIPNYIYVIFCFLGILAFIELFQPKESVI